MKRGRCLTGRTENKGAREKGDGLYKHIMIESLLWTLLFRFVSIFGGFTFTDAMDFAPLLTLVLGLVGVVWICRSLRAKLSLPLFAALLFLSLWPLLPNFGLLFMARELQSVRGSWPQVMVDDPKGLCGHVSARFDSLFHLVNYLDAFSGALMVVFLALFFAVRSRLSSVQRWLCLSSMFICLLVVCVDPGNLYAWWLD